jgi:opacity protein-like surface antigen
MRRIELLAVAGAVLIGSQPLAAQTPQLALEIRGGYAIPTGDWNEEDAFENGLGIGGSVMAMVTPQIGVYAGYEAFRFGVEEDEEGVEADATDAGFRAGISFSTNVPAYQNVTPFIEAGVLYNTMTIGASGDGTTIDIESEESLGFEAGVGFAATVAPRVSVVPMVRYRTHDVEFDLEGLEGSDTVQYVIVGLGLRLSL